MSTKSELELIAQYEKELNESNGMQWYIVTAVTGKEEAVAKDIYDKLVGYNFKDHVSDIKVLKEERNKTEIFSADDLPNTYNRKQKGVTWKTIDLGNNKFKYERTKVTSVNKFPGYIFIKCIMDDEVWYVIRNTANVTGVVGSSGRGVKPIPISNDEFERMQALKTSQTDNNPSEVAQVTISAPVNEQPSAVQEAIKLAYQVGDIINLDKVGEATISKIDLDKKMFEVTVDLLGDTQTLTYYDLNLLKDKQ